MERRQTKEIEITDYTDYVPYLNDLVEYKRQVIGFSYRVFCHKSGFKSPTYLKWVLDGTRSISLKSVHKFIAGLSLDRRSAQYFTLMVNYREAGDSETRRLYYEQMLSFKRHHGGSLTQDTYEYLSHWYYVAIRELIGSPDFVADPRWIRERLGGDLTLWEIRNGLETLERLQLIRRGAGGKWEQTARDLRTEDEVKSVAAYNYHNEMLELAKGVLSRCGAEERDYRSVVSMLDEETCSGLKEKIHKFQEEVVEYLQRKESNNKRVRRQLYALNLQLLPLTARRKEGL